MYNSTLNTGFINNTYIYQQVGLLYAYVLNSAIKYIAFPPGWVPQDD